MEDNKGPRLPIELIVRIVEYLAPSTAVALVPSDPTAVAIRSCTLTCRATYPTALRLLYKHCLYIDSSRRLCGLLVAVNHHASFRADKTSVGSAQQQMCYATTTNASRDNKDDVDNADARASCISESSATRTLPPVDIVPHLQNLYLSPFQATSIDDLPAAMWIYEFFTIVRHILRRLVVAIALNTLPSYDDHLDVRLWLYRAFAELTNLEEFVCLCDDFRVVPMVHSIYVPLEPPNMTFPPLAGRRHYPVQTSTYPIWAQWRNLRRLSVAGEVCWLTPQSVNIGHVTGMPHFPKLESIVIRPSRSSIDRWELQNLFTNLTSNIDHDIHILQPVVLNPRNVSEDQQTRRRLVQQAGNDAPLSQALAFYSEQICRARLFNIQNSGKGNSKVDFRVVFLDPSECIADRKQKCASPMQAWTTRRALDGSLWNVDSSNKFRMSSYDPQLWYDPDFGEAEMVPEWLVEHE